MSGGSARITEIDGLRAIAFLLVFLCHAATPFSGGFIGVDIFFVISGFVITRSILLSKPTLTTFYQNRFFRIIPAIIPVLLFTLAVSSTGLVLASSFDVFASAFSFMNWTRAFDVSQGKYLGHFWSLAIEEQFYLIWPFILLFLLNGRSEKIRPFLVILIISVLLWRSYIYHTSFDAGRLYNGTDTRIDQLAVGCLLNFINRKEISNILFPCSLIVIFVLSLTLNAKGESYMSYGYMLSTLVSASLICSVAWTSSPLVQKLNHPALQWGGSRSYALYLWHFPLIGLFRTIDPVLETSTVIAVGFVTCLFAELSFRYVEQPGQRLRKFIQSDTRKRLALS